MGESHMKSVGGGGRETMKTYGSIVHAAALLNKINKLLF